MEQEFIQNQEVFRPHELKDKEEREKMEELRGSPLAAKTRRVPRSQETRT